MKLINILIIFLLTLAPCYAEFGNEVIVDGTGIQTDDDAELNSLDVLLYVKSSTLEPHTANTPVVIKPESGSTTDDVLEIQSEDGTAITTFDNSGGLQVDSFGVGCEPSGTTGEAKIGTILPCDDSSPNVMRLPSGSSATKIFSIQDSEGAEVFEFYKSGTALTTGAYRAIGDISAGSFKPYTPTKDWIAQLRDNTKSFLFQDSSATTVASIDSSGKGTFDGGVVAQDVLEYHDSSAKRFEVTTSAASASDVDVDLTFYGGTNTGSITFDDSRTRFLARGTFEADGFYSGNARIDQIGGQASPLAPVEFTGGIETADGYGISIGGTAPAENVLEFEEEATPATPASGKCKLYLDSSDGNFKIIFDDGDVVTIATNP